MRRIDSLFDEMRGVARFELDSGNEICFDARHVRQYGVEALLRETGHAHLIPGSAKRYDVMQRGRKIGTVPATFDPASIQSTNSLFYEPRRGDFVWTGEGYNASPTLGPGDLEAVPGFIWEREKSPEIKDS